MTKEIITQLKSRRAELMTELSRIERAIVALDAAPAQVAKKKGGRPKKVAIAPISEALANGHTDHGGRAMVTEG